MGRRKYAKLQGTNMKRWLAGIDTDLDEDERVLSGIGVVIRNGEMEPSVMKRWKTDTEVC
jgi:hypothetical protein